MREFFQEIHSIKSSEIILDFEKIDFISRSCADEYLSQKNNSNKILKEINMENEVSNMIEVVRKSRENFFQITNNRSLPILNYA